MLKTLLNSNYGEGKIINNIYEESYKIRKKISNVKIKNSQTVIEIGNGLTFQRKTAA
jgi:16S rRNA A1518/A1519 N6-dimethyltransferase RsmA/KsgA/DIM1 with predicted DNA glycosylase/AP lyase activity